MMILMTLVTWEAGKEIFLATVSDFCCSALYLLVVTSHDLFSGACLCFRCLVCALDESVIMSTNSQLCTSTSTLSSLFKEGLNCFVLDCLLNCNSVQMIVMVMSKYESIVYLQQFGVLNYNFIGSSLLNYCMVWLRKLFLIFLVECRYSWHRHIVMHMHIKKWKLKYVLIVVQMLKLIKHRVTKILKMTQW